MALVASATWIAKRIYDSYYKKPFTCASSQFNYSCLDIEETG